MPEMLNMPTCMKTLNPVDGCNFGCPYCYARRMNERFKWVEDWNKPQFFPERIKFNTKSHKIFFIDSMSDFAAWEPAWQERVITAVRQNPQNDYMTLTKRPELFKGNLPNTWWYGVSVTTAADKHRIEIMRQNITGAHLHVCFEPLQGDVGELDLRGVEWIVIGPESGNRKGKIKPEAEWIMNIVRQADAAGIPIGMKTSLAAIIGQENIRGQWPFRL